VTSTTSTTGRAQTCCDDSLDEAAERMAFGTCIANIWVRPAQTAYGAAALLSGAYPGRFVLGLGVGYPNRQAP